MLSRLQDPSCNCKTSVMGTCCLCLRMQRKSSFYQTKKTEIAGMHYSDLEQIIDEDAGLLDLDSNSCSERPILITESCESKRSPNLLGNSCIQKMTLIQDQKLQIRVH